jgi:hypothetical protein
VDDTWEEVEVRDNKVDKGSLHKVDIRDMEDIVAMG